MDGLPELETLFIKQIYTTCPHCGYRDEWWYKDPRGDKHQCMKCDKHYTVSGDAKLELDKSFSKES